MPYRRRDLEVPAALTIHAPTLSLAKPVSVRKVGGPNANTGAPLSTAHIESDTSIEALEGRIQSAWNTGTADRGAVETVLWHLDRGTLRVATPPDDPAGEWTTHPWICLLYTSPSPRD